MRATPNEERHPDSPLFPQTPVQRIAAHLVELYVDEFATIPAMSSLRGLPLQRFAGSYAAWLVQRVLDDYGALAAEARTHVDEAVAGTGWDAVLAHVPRHRVSKRGFHLVLAPWDEA